MLEAAIGIGLAIIVWVRIVGEEYDDIVWLALFVILSSTVAGSMAFLFAWALSKLGCP